MAHYSYESPVPPTYGPSPPPFNQIPSSSHRTPYPPPINPPPTMPSPYPRPKQPFASSGNAPSAPHVNPPSSTLSKYPPSNAPSPTSLIPSFNPPSCTPPPPTKVTSTEHGKTNDRPSPNKLHWLPHPTTKLRLPKVPSALKFINLPTPTIPTLPVHVYFPTPSSIS